MDRGLQTKAAQDRLNATNTASSSPLSTVERGSFGPVFMSPINNPVRGSAPPSLGPALQPMAGRSSTSDRCITARKACLVVALPLRAGPMVAAGPPHHLGDRPVDRVIAVLGSAIRLDPGQPIMADFAPLSRSYVRRWRENEPHFSQTTALAPAVFSGYPRHPEDPFSGPCYVACGFYDNAHAIPHNLSRQGRATTSRAYQSVPVPQV